MQLKIKDEFGIVTERARQREKFADKIDRRVEAYIFSPAGRAVIERKVNERVKAEVDAILARKAEERMAEIEQVAPPSGPTVGKVMQTVCEVTGCTLQALTGPRHSRRIAWPRHLAMYVLVKVREDLSLPVIGQAFGGRDHTTVLYAVRKIDETRQHEKPFADWLADPRIVALLEQAPATSSRVPRGPKLTPDQAKAIRFSGMTVREIATRYGISESHAADVRGGRVWRDAA